MIIFIYAIYFPTSERKSPYYIGYSYRLHYRMIQGHLRNDVNSLVGNALQKYDDWQILIIRMVNNYKEAKRLEIKEIKRYNCITPYGYNLTAGVMAELIIIILKILKVK